MTDNKYQTIDPLILQTLQLNQKRIFRIFDILHGRDVRPDTERLSRSINASTPSSKLPKIVQNDKTKTQKYKFAQPKSQKIKFHGVSSSYIESSPQKYSTLENIQQQPVSKRLSSIPVKRKQIQVQSNQNTIQLKPSKQKAKLQRQRTTIQPKQQQLQLQRNLSPTQRRNKLIKDYGMTNIRRNKSVEINPKDLYRVQIQHLVSRPSQIEQMEDVEKLMVRLKRRYQHLRKFDQHYYSNLNQNQFALI